MIRTHILHSVAIIVFGKYSRHSQNNLQAKQRTNSTLLMFKLKSLIVLNSINASTLTSFSESDIFAAHTLHSAHFRIRVEPKQDRIPTIA
jgi:hypothetical protein